MRRNTLHKSRHTSDTMTRLGKSCQPTAWDVLCVCDCDQRRRNGTRAVGDDKPISAESAHRTIARRTVWCALPTRRRVRIKKFVVATQADAALDIARNVPPTIPNNAARTVDA